MKVAGVLMMLIGAVLVIGPLSMTVMFLVPEQAGMGLNPIIFTLYGLLVLMGLGLLYAGYRMIRFRP